MFCTQHLAYKAGWDATHGLGDATHVSNHDCWRQVETPKPRKIAYLASYRGGAPDSLGLLLLRRMYSIYSAMPIFTSACLIPNSLPYLRNI